MRSAARGLIEGFQIGGKGPCRVRIARIVLSQKQEEREPEAAMSETASAAMTCGAAFRKKPVARLALSEILSERPAAEYRCNCSNGDQAAPEFSQGKTSRRRAHAKNLL